MPSNVLFERSNKIALDNQKYQNKVFHNDPDNFTGFDFDAISMKSSYISNALCAALFFGLPYNPRTIKNNTSAGFPGIAKLWCILVSCFKGCIVLGFLCTCALYIPSKLTIFTYYALSFVIILLTFYLVRNNEKITQSIREMCKILHRISPDKKPGSKFCIFQIVLFVVSVSYGTFVTKWSLSYVHYDVSYSIAGYDIFETYKFCIIGIPALGLATAGITVIICNSIFGTLRNTIGAFRGKLKERYLVKNCCRRNIVEDITLFRKIACCHRNLDDSLSPILFLTIVFYTLYVSNNVSILLTRRFPPLTTLGYLLCMVQAMIPFVFLIFSAGNVTNECKYLNECLMFCSEDIATASPSASDTALFTVLSDNIRSTNFQFTAADMFILQNALVFTVGGLLVTYGIIQYQISTIV